MILSGAKLLEASKALYACMGKQHWALLPGSGTARDDPPFPWVRNTWLTCEGAYN